MKGQGSSGDCSDKISTSKFSIANAAAIDKAPGSQPEEVAAGRLPKHLFREGQAAGRPVGNRFDVEQIGQAAVEDSG